MHKAYKVRYQNAEQAHVQPHNVKHNDKMHSVEDKHTSNNSIYTALPGVGVI